MSEGFQLPKPLINSINKVFAVEENQLLASHNNIPPVSVRLNPFKPCDDFNDLEKVKWCDHAFYLPERRSFIFDPVFHAGSYYVQEASSMFLEFALKHCVDLKRDFKVLDLCASPGGKSTLINSLITPNSMLVSNEVIKTRVGTLAENMSKWGTCNVIVSNNDPKDFQPLEEFFDIIVVDAPCSGSGLFRKQEDAIDHWSEDNVNICSSRQKRILDDIIPALNQGGILIYSTCSYSEEENESIANMLVHEHGLESIQIPIQKEWGIVETLTNKTTYGYRFFPHLLKGEGFFISAFKKPGELNTHSSRSKNNLEKANSKELVLLSEICKTDSNNTIIKQKENFFLINAMIENNIGLLSKHLNIRKKGTFIGEIKGKDVVPHHEMALSIHLQENINFFDVSLEESLRFLKKEDFKSLNECKTGIGIVRYKGHNLGWAKFLGTRFNNYLPKEWRILKEINF